MQKISLVKLLVATVVWTGIIDAAEQDTYKVKVQNLTNRQPYLYFFDPNNDYPPGHLIEPKKVSIIETPVYTEIAFDRGGMMSHPKGLIEISNKQNQALKNGNAYIEINENVKKEPFIVIKQSQAEPELKKSSAIPSGISPEAVEITTLRTQLKNALDDLAVANARIVQLENQVRELQQELQPGS